MKVKVKMPDFGTTTSEVTVLSWLVGLGQRIERGQPLMEIETDKSTMTVESIVTGVVKEFLVECNESVNVGQVIVLIETDAPDESASTGATPPAVTPTIAKDEYPRTPSPAAIKPSSRGGTLFSRNRAQKTADGNAFKTESE